MKTLLLIYSILRIVHSETAGQMAVCCQNLTLGALSSRSAHSVLNGALFENFRSLSEHAS